MTSIFQHLVIEPPEVEAPLFDVMPTSCHRRGDLLRLLSTGPTWGVARPVPQEVRQRPRKYAAEGPKPGGARKMPATMKKCRRCHETKQIRSFDSRGEWKDTICKACRKKEGKGT